MAHPQHHLQSMCAGLSFNFSAGYWVVGMYLSFDFVGPSFVSMFVLAIRDS